MRFLILLLCCSTGLTASAQFWHRKPKPEPRVDLAEARDYTTINVKAVMVFPENAVHDHQLRRSVYNLERAEDLVMTEAKHNMRYRQYNLASYNFSDLAALYVQQNRFSEAKWYLLQSNAIARDQADNKHTLSNLLLLSDIKFRIGELELAKADMLEARDIAATNGMQTELIEIEKRIQYLQNNKLIAAKAEIRYDSAVEIANGKKNIN